MHSAAHEHHGKARSSTPGRSRSGSQELDPDDVDTLDLDPTGMTDGAIPEEPPEFH